MDGWMNGWIDGRMNVTNERTNERNNERENERKQCTKEITDHHGAPLHGSRLELDHLHHTPGGGDDNLRAFLEGLLHLPLSRPAVHRAHLAPVPYTQHSTAQHSTCDRK